MPIYPTPEGGYAVRVCVNYRRAHRRLPPGTPKSEARALEAALRVALGERHNAVVPGDPRVTDLLAAYVEHAKAALRSPGTAQHHVVRIWHIAERFRASQARQLRAAIVGELRGRYQPGTINRSLGTAKRALRLAWESGLTPVDHSAHIQRLPEHNERHDDMPLEVIRSIAHHASEPVRAAIWLSLLTGCRRGEVCKIERADIHADHIRIQAGNTKTLRHRRVPIFPALRPWLQYLPLQIGAEGIKSGWRRAREAAGYPTARFHALRHSCAMMLLDLGEPIEVVQEVLGHASITTTLKYARVRAERAGAARQRLGELVAPAVAPQLDHAQRKRAK